MPRRGRGRGRGGQMVMFDKLESLGLSRSDLYSLSGAGQSSSAQELYPPLARKPIANTNYDPDIVKQAEIGRSIRSRLRQKFAFLTKEDKKKDIDRYSDKYHNQQDEMGWTPDWSQFPDELRPSPPKKTKKRVPQVKPNLKGARKSTSTKTAKQLFTSAETADQPSAETAKQPSTSAKTAEILAKAKEQLGAQLPDGGHKDEEEEEEEKEKKVDKEEKEDEEEKEEEEGEAEEQDVDEDETDYNLTYFDNGDGYGEDDDEDDEPAYN